LHLKKAKYRQALVANENVETPKQLVRSLSLEAKLGYPTNLVCEQQLMIAPQIATLYPREHHKAKTHEDERTHAVEFDISKARTPQDKQNQTKSRRWLDNSKARALQGTQCFNKDGTRQAKTHW
jgi:hypothetical protein